MSLLLRLLRRIRSILRIKVMTLRVLWRARKRPINPSIEWTAIHPSAVISVVMSFRVTLEGRFKVLQAVVDDLASTLGPQGIALDVTEAPVPEFSTRVRSVFDRLELPISYRKSSSHLSVAHMTAAENIATPYVYFQFDDQLTTNLSAEFLFDACQFLERYRGMVDVVTVLWPTRVSVVPEQRIIEVVTHRVRRTRLGMEYSFAPYGFRRPVRVERIGSHTFGIFENFTYGFYFNNLVAPSGDFGARARWYIENVAEENHQIELAASGRTVGPYWTHLAICLDGVALLDLDFQHTDAATRPENKSNREVFQAIGNGYEVVTKSSEA